MRLGRTRLCSRSNVSLLAGYTRCSHTGQTKPGALEKVNRLEELGTIGEQRLKTKVACEQAPCESGKKFGERSVNPAAKRVGVRA